MLLVKVTWNECIDQDQEDEKELLYKSKKWKEKNEAGTGMKRVKYC